MIVFFSAEYLKVAGYVVSGFAAARVWFAKEIALGKRDTAKAVAAVKTEIAKIEAEAKNLSLDPLIRVSIAYTMVVNRLKSIL